MHRCLNYRRVYRRLQTFPTHFISTFITRYEINQAICESLRRYDVKNATETASIAAELSVNIGV